MPREETMRGQYAPPASSFRQQCTQAQASCHNPPPQGVAWFFIRQEGWGPHPPLEPGSDKNPLRRHAKPSQNPPLEPMPLTSLLLPQAEEPIQMTHSCCISQKGNLWAMRAVSSRTSRVVSVATRSPVTRHRTTSWLGLRNPEEWLSGILPMDSLATRSIECAAHGTVCTLPVS